jgi:hypothetical protein
MLTRTLTRAVASQGATPKAKSSAKAAGGATPGLDMDTAAVFQTSDSATPISDGLFIVSPVSHFSAHSNLSPFGSPAAASSCMIFLSSPVRVDQVSEAYVCPPSKRKSILKDLTTPSKRNSVYNRPDMSEVALIVDFKVDAPVEIVRTPIIQHKHIDAFRKTNRCRVSTPGVKPDTFPAVQASARQQRFSKRQCTLRSPPPFNQTTMENSFFFTS